MLKEIQELNEYFEARTPDSLKECEDKINKKHVKMIDFGWCISYNPELRTK